MCRRNARIARDLHDTLAQDLSGSLMLLQATERDWAHCRLWHSSRWSKRQSRNGGPPWTRSFRCPRSTARSGTTG
ncbi:histidine kinase [Streptomyces sioyaensis]|uniref:histidine kinase n=1 Tax=Streptomyces sioyaensis TaxID=67364 RepID=UPI0036675436